MRRYLDLYRYFVAQRFKILLEYRLNFFIGTVSTIFQQGAWLLTLWVVMRQIPNLGGWSFDEVLFVYGLITLAQSITHMFADNLWTIGWDYIRSGQFDRFLVRPIDPLFHLLADRFCHDGLGHFLVGAVLVVKASAALHLAWTPLSLAYLAVSVLSGGAIFIALNLITATSAFWIIESIPVTQIIFSTHEFAKYPLSIYHWTVRFLLTWIIPYGFASFYPASYLLGRDHSAVVWLGPLVGSVLLIISYRVWLFGLRHYSGTGS
jgi:ABC-2 type transport system permease protein